ASLFTLIGYYGCGAEYCHVINFDPLVGLFATKQDGSWVANITVQSFLDYPKFLFLVAAQSGNVVPLSGTAVGQAALIFIPVSLVTICEHIGDHKNMSGVLQRDLLEKPGLTRTLIGDGVATAISGVCCGAANTTYGENVAVIGVTKIASTKVIFLACLFSMALGFFSPLMGLVQTIPACVTGGVSMILYGFIASSGVKMLINEHVDMAKTKNIFVTSVILVAGIGGLVFSFAIGNFAVSITSVSVAMILGIVLNAILREKKTDPEAEAK
ncbi:MAG TPA: uracil-xanthine permease, partial [Firmicutes bacterium]|nr:uracil-xanthine permease [Bacillota bacterium]